MRVNKTAKIIPGLDEKSGFVDMKMKKMSIIVDATYKVERRNFGKICSVVEGNFRPICSSVRNR